MTVQIAPLTKTEAQEQIAQMRYDADAADLEAIAEYRASLPPFLIGASNAGRVLDMLFAAIHARWALKKEAGPWLSIEELSWGTFVTQQCVAEALLDLAFHPTIKLSRRCMDGIYRFTLGEGEESEDE